jgi:hypothetical protein
VSVYQPKNSPHWHYDFQYKGHRIYGSTGKTTRAEAKKVEKAFRDEAIRAVATGEINRPKVEIPSLDVAAAEWWDYKGSRLAQGGGLEARLEQAVRLVGKNKPVNEITTSDIAAAIQKRRGILTQGKRPIKNATANRDIIDTVRPLIRRQKKLLNDGSGPPVFFPEIDWTEVRLAEPKPKPRDFTALEIGDFRAALPAHWHDFVHIQARYGLRLAEMFFATSDVQPAERRLLLRERKGDDDHTLPLTQEDAAMLAARAGRARAASLKTVWFRQLKSGKLKALTYNGAKQALRTAMRASGLHESKGAKGSHDLRHHAAMTALRASKSLRGTQRLLGHADIKSTLVYAHAMEDDVRDIVELVSRNSPEAPAKNTGREDEGSGAKPLSDNNKDGTIG